MSDAPENQDQEPKKSGSIFKLIIWLFVAVLSIGGGFAAPILIGQLQKAPDPESVETTPVVDIEEESDYIDFDEVIVNLREQQFSRFLKINITLEVPKSKKLEIEELIELKKAVLLNHINLHFAEISTEDLKGKFGQNRIRRAMHDYFNEVLFGDGQEWILDILFRELHVQ